jgi:hypothetical protein
MVIADSRDATENAITADACWLRHTAGTPTDAGAAVISWTPYGASTGKLKDTCVPPISCLTYVSCTYFAPHFPNDSVVGHLLHHTPVCAVCGLPPIFELTQRVDHAAGMYLWHPCCCGSGCGSGCKYSLYAADVLQLAALPPEYTPPLSCTP